MGKERKNLFFNNGTVGYHRASARKRADMNMEFIILSSDGGFYYFKNFGVGINGTWARE